MARLTAFLDDPGVFEYSQNDCCFFPGNWVRLVTGIDGGDPWRGTYQSQAMCERFLEAQGGILAAMTTAAARVGLSVTAEPVRGDIAIVGVRGVGSGEPLIGAICTGQRWAAMSWRGLRIIRAQSVRAWRLPHG